MLQALGEVLGEHITPLQDDPSQWSWVDRTNRTRRINRGANLCAAHWPFKPVRRDRGLSRPDVNAGSEGDFAGPSSRDSPVVSVSHKHSLMQQSMKPNPGENQNLLFG